MKLIDQLDNPLVKKHILISFIGIAIGVLLYNYFATSVDTVHRSFSMVEALLSGVCGIIASYIIYAISKKLDTLLPWNTQLASRFSAGILLHFVTALAMVALLYFGYKKIISEAFPDTYPNTFIKLAIILFIIMLIYNTIYFALYSYYTYATLQIETVKYERQQIDLQLKALKSQLSSHFLFNNLNTISSLAFKDAKASESYIKGLARVYNYSLNSYHSKLVFLHEEISMLRSYLLLLKTRHGDLLNYNLRIDEKILSTKVPPLTLQMLVENIVKHNVVDANNVLHIDIFSDKDSITVKNNITKAPTNVSSFHIGLKNIESRYQLLLKQGISIVKDTYFIVKIPTIQ